MTESQIEQMNKLATEYERNWRGVTEYDQELWVLNESFKAGFQAAFDIAEKNIDAYIEKSHRMELKLADAVEALEDFKDFGTRHDVNPTGQFMPCGCFNDLNGGHWQNYIKSQDEYVRETAKECLARLGVKDE